MTLILETPRLILRKAASSDGAFIMELMNERSYLANIGDRGVRTLDDAVAYLDAKYRTSYEKLGYGSYVVEEKTTSTPIGICGYVKRDSLEDADIGFAFLERCWSRGYGYEAASGVLEYGRDVLGFSKVLGVTAQANLPSIRLLQKLGFSYERLLLLPGYSEKSLLFSKVLERAEVSD